MLESMRYCYERLRQNSKEADEITAWIDKVRVELKKNIIKKQNREINNRQIYSYMHDIFGVDILNVFDLRQEDEDRLQGKKAAENANEKDKNKESENKETQNKDAQNKTENENLGAKEES